ncbi:MULTISPECIES: hypothetical protein [Cocleimonas]|nr:MULTISPECIES: hypothetical protein [Cocleimonas]MEB8433051.1 hypothetical protein [Cocleimonas sp. KMM 6892]MEC4715968.1 hypothetical protein [Cocleimonas sp. KMM 6895]MEC4745429.1 hypothetical protein [Cocleimonas sp. KMM 6896]
MKTPRISHAIADISYKDSLDSLYQLKVFIGKDYEDKIAEQAKIFKDADLSTIKDDFYVRSIDELRGLMRATPSYNFVVRSYLVYSYYKKSSDEVYVSSFGGNKINTANVKNFLVHHILSTKDSGLLSHLIEMISGYQNNYDVQANTFMLSDFVHTYCRKQRIDDDVIIDSVFVSSENTDMSNKDVIALMRDHNRIPEGMFLREEFIALEPAQIVTLACLLIDNQEAVAA